MPHIEERFFPKLYQFLATAIEITKADKGNVQLLDLDQGHLKIVAHIGFNDDFLQEFKVVVPGQCVCGTALRKKKRVVVEDAAKDPIFSGYAPVFKRYGYCGVQSTPLLDYSGNIFGVLSTHFVKPVRLTEIDLNRLDAYVAQAVPVLLKKLGEVPQTLVPQERQ